MKSYNIYKCFFYHEVYYLFELCGGFRSNTKLGHCSSFNLNAWRGLPELQMIRNGFTGYTV